MSEFEPNLAIIIGINDYQQGIPSLQTAVNDAEQLALILEEKYDYEIERVLNQEATGEQLRQLIEHKLLEAKTKDDKIAGDACLDLEDKYWDFTKKAEFQRDRGLAISGIGNYSQGARELKAAKKRDFTIDLNPEKVAKKFASKWGV